MQSQDELQNIIYNFAIERIKQYRAMYYYLKIETLKDIFEKLKKIFNKLCKIDISKHFIKNFIKYAYLKFTGVHKEILSSNISKLVLF